MSRRETIAQLPRSWLAECFIRSPSSRSEALRLDQHVEAILCRTQMFFAAQSDVGLHG